MELYKRFSHTVLPNEALGVVANDGLFEKAINEKITKWATDMKTRHPNFRYRIVNASNTDPWARTGRKMDSSMTATVHLAYEI